MSDKARKVVIYTARSCPYCHAAKKLLQSRGVSYEEVDVSADDAMREKLVQMTGGRETVPQLFIDGQSIGGYDDLVRLIEEGGNTLVF